ncbi:RNA-directed DNA polymerase from mobile element jockey-like, partial [Brachionus plicatilis]
MTTRTLELERRIAKLEESRRELEDSNLRKDAKIAELEKKLNNQSQNSHTTSTANSYAVALSRTGSAQQKALINAVSKDAKLRESKAKNFVVIGAPLSNATNENDQKAADKTIIDELIDEIGASKESVVSVYRLKATTDRSTNKTVPGPIITNAETIGEQHAVVGTEDAKTKDQVRTSSLAPFRDAAITNKTKQNARSQPQAVLHKQPNSLKCLYTNATSLNSTKQAELATLADNDSLDLIGISETWFTDSSTNWLQNFNTYRRDRDTHADLLNDQAIEQQVHFPTFYSSEEKAGNTLDLILTESQYRVQELFASPPLGLAKQGHVVLIWDYMLYEKKEEVNFRSTPFVYNRGNYTCIIQHLKSLDWESLFQDKLVRDRAKIFQNI